MTTTGVGAWSIAMGILLAGGSAAAEPVQSPPSLRETGQVADAPAPRPTAQIKDAPAASGKIDDTVLARQIRSRFAALNACPTEVARHKRIGIGAASAGKLT